MRASSPPSGFSILITSAPMSASKTPASGPASAWPTSMTRTPSSGNVTGVLSIYPWPRAAWLAAAALKLGKEAARSGKAPMAPMPPAVSTRAVGCIALPVQRANRCAQMVHDRNRTEALRRMPGWRNSSADSGVPCRAGGDGALDKKSPANCRPGADHRSDHARPGFHRDERAVSGPQGDPVQARTKATTGPICRRPTITILPPTRSARASGATPSIPGGPTASASGPASARPSSRRRDGRTSSSSAIPLPRRWARPTSRASRGSGVRRRPAGQGAVESRRRVLQPGHLSPQDPGGRRAAGREARRDLRLPRSVGHRRRRQRLSCRRRSRRQGRFLPGQRV